MNNEEEKNIEEEKAAKKKLMKDLAQDDFPMDGLEVTPEGELRVKYGTAYDWAIAHGFIPANEFFEKIEKKYFGENEQD